MKKNLLLGLAEIGAGVLIALPFEDTLTAGATLPITTIAGVALVYDGIKRL
jgi:hypothetical protein